MDKKNIKRNIGRLPAGRKILFLYKRVHLFLRDELAPDLKSRRWTLNESEWAPSAMRVPMRSNADGTQPGDRMPRDEEAVLQYICAVQRHIGEE